ncbi:hypothetical protein JCGZ_00124 [Jatropha curcas]|uniref:Uncharacterized protein n=1 Tax=Jatropha curcas TaxID=180498 RepID=A0A067JIV0_JATCU|nr:hypothetical protein JCGZ_00124 [Jatropha curcas]
MANESVKHHQMEGQDNNHGKAVEHVVMPPPQTIDPQVAADLVQAYLQFATVLERLPKAPHSGGKPTTPGGPTNQRHKEHNVPLPSPKRQGHPASEFP